jgi:hypothetical protein
MELVPCIGDPESCTIPVDARSLQLGIELSSPAHRAGLLRVEIGLGYDFSVV